jgi:hypothetical protein
MRMIVEQLVEWRLAGETEVLEENLPQRHFSLLPNVIFKNLYPNVLLKVLYIWFCNNKMGGFKLYKSEILARIGN